MNKTPASPSDPVGEVMALADWHALNCNHELHNESRAALEAKVRELGKRGGQALRDDPDLLLTLRRALDVIQNLLYVRQREWIYLPWDTERVAAALRAAIDSGPVGEESNANVHPT